MSLPAAVDVPAVLFRLDERPIVASRFGPVAAFQEALSDALLDCGRADVPIDGVLGVLTEEALNELAACTGDEALLTRHSGVIDEDTWAAVAPEVEPPDALARAVMLTLTFEGTDFDHAEWNLATEGDRTSAITWGPFGATAGWGAEVQRVLLRVDARDPALVEAAFGDEAHTARALCDVDGPDAAGFLAPVFATPARRDVWSTAFRRLGADAKVREDYVATALSDEWLGGSLTRLWTLLPDPAAATEVDLAFFLDLAVHVSVTDERVRNARKASWTAKTPAERRRAIGRAFVSDLGRWAGHREGRDGAYVIDAAALSDAERASFDRFGRVRASDVGLSDDRPAPLVF